ncbi:hypothetical protein DMO17_18650 [Aquipseudomonas alcaligenes]|uniref:DUF2975 domain-containing protein n=1 Tax=Aquipseudomonas alcaligenes TaxID=43263 RepID=A0A2V4KJ06_AQUAC|nr:hypothetical protein [Pseudomonas alcaligenes]PYC20218.1 hypothetical protein DMO17_18650 [Pseudomonas alcaligenes]
MSSTVSFQRVQRYSIWFSRISLLFGILILLQNVVFWITPGSLQRGAAMLLPDGTPHEVNAAVITVGFFLNALVMGLLLWACWQAHRLFQAFANGQVLVSATGVRLFRIGFAFALVLPGQVTSTAVITLLLTWGNPEAQRLVDVSVDAAHLSMAVAGALMMAVGWAMGEAARIAEDNAQII